MMAKDPVESLVRVGQFSHPLGCEAIELFAVRSQHFSTGSARCFVEGRIITAPLDCRGSSFQWRREGRLFLSRQYQVPSGTNSRLVQQTGKTPSLSHPFPHVHVCHAHSSRAKVSAEGDLLQDGSDLYCVSAPPSIRLRNFANSAAQAHLAVLVRNARAAAVAAEAGTRTTIRPLSAVEARRSTVARAAPRDGANTPFFQPAKQRGGSVLLRRNVDEVVDDDEDGELGSSSGSSSGGEGFGRGTTWLPNESEARR